MDILFGAGITFNIPLLGLYQRWDRERGTDGGTRKKRRKRRRRRTTTKNRERKRRKGERLEKSGRSVAEVLKGYTLYLLPACSPPTTF